MAQYKLALCVATMRPKPENNDLAPGDLAVALANASTVIPVHVQYNTPTDNLGVIGSYQKLYETTTEEILAYIHDDVIIRERRWDERVLQEFEDPSVGVVGFGGGLRHGTDDLYKTPYRLQQLARARYRSNTDDAEVHGERFTGSCEAAVVDGFAIIARRRLLDLNGGWPYKDLFFHSYDYWVCCAAHELGYKIRVVGVRCHHRGGVTSTSADYNETVMALTGRTDAQIHEESHKFIYERFRSVLPWIVK